MHQVGSLRVPVYDPTSPAEIIVLSTAIGGKLKKKIDKASEL